MSRTSSSANPDVALPLIGTIREHRRLFLAEGIILSVLGVAAMVLPAVAGVVATAVLGWLFLLSGIVGAVATMRAQIAPGFGWALVSALLALLAGGALLWDPLRGTASLTYVLTAFFILDGVVMIILALIYRSDLSDRWQWILLNGIADLILAAIIIAGLPGTLMWVLGLLVGIDLLFGGAALIALALQARADPVPSPR